MHFSHTNHSTLEPQLRSCSILWWPTPLPKPSIKGSFGMGPDTEKGADFLMRFLNAPRQLPWGRGSVNCHLFETDFMVKNGNVERDDSYSGINAIVFTDCISHTHITLLNPHSALTALRFIPLTCTRPPAGSYTGVYRGGGECGTVFFPIQRALP